MIHKLYQQIKDRIKPELCNFKVVLLFIMGLEKLKPVKPKKQGTFSLKQKIFYIDFFAFFSLLL